MKGADAGEVTGVFISDVPSLVPDATVTIPINTATTFVAKCDPGTAHPAAGWTVDPGGPGFTWSVSSSSSVTASPLNTAQTTVSVPAFPSAGTYTVTLSCNVDYTAMSDEGFPGDIINSASQTVTIKVIGGPISGDNDIHWYCITTKFIDWGHLSAASGQPAGTTYSWSLAGNAQYVGDTLPPTSANATYCGSGAGSNKPGDVKATVTYSLNGVTATSDPFPITVHAPTQFVVLSVDPPTQYRGPDIYGFANQLLHFKVLDGLNQPITNAYWDESWALIGNGNGFEPPHIGGPLDNMGMSVDKFTDTLFPAPTNAGVYSVSGPYMHSYWATDEGAGFAGGGIGCPIQVYPNVFYNVSGVTGNGF